jgi:phosphoribosyl-AMP cyclohydrolase
MFSLKSRLAPAKKKNISDNNGSKMDANLRIAERMRSNFLHQSRDVIFAERKRKGNWMKTNRKNEIEKLERITLNANRCLRGVSILVANRTAGICHDFQCFSD